MLQKPLYEVSKQSIAISKSEEPFSSWQNSILTVRTEKGLNLIEFSHNVQCLDKKIDCFVKFIPCPKVSPATSLFTKKFMSGPVSNFDFTQMVVDQALFPHNPVIMEELARIVAFEWSPPDLRDSFEGVIAVLNNFGNIEFFIPKVGGYSSVLNISSIIEKRFKRQLTNEFPQNLNELRDAVYAVETSAICWGGKNNNFFTFVTAQKNGDIFIWKLQCNNEKISIEELSKMQTDAGEIITIKWIPISSDKFWLILTNVLGQLFAYCYQWDGHNIKLVKTNCLWPHQDRMAIKYVQYSVIGNKMVLLFNKHRHLVALMIDCECNKIAEYINNINDYRISVLSEMNGDYYVATINCKLYKINIAVIDQKIDVKLVPIDVKENLANKDLYGMHFSKNNIVCALCVIDRRVMCRKENLELEIFFYSQEVSHEKEIACLLDNPTKKLLDYWDCTEMLRYKAMKLKILPLIDYNQLYTDGSTDLYKLKLYYFLLSLYHSLESILKNGSKGWLPETSLEAVREKILALHTCALITDFSNKSEMKGTLNSFEKECFVGGKKYLKYYCEKYNVNLNDLIPVDVFNTVLDYDYICQCCDEKISGFSCVNGHLNMFCALTLTPIESDNYLVCNGCGVLARIELKPQKPMCVFCCQYFNNHSLPS